MRARRVAHAARAASLLLLTGVACSGEARGPAAGDSGGDDSAVIELPYAPCPAATGVGEFVIELGADYTSASGKVFDTVAPNLIADELAREGQCQLLRVPPRSCIPACPVSTHMCGPDNECVPLPHARDVGTVTLSGLVVPVEMTANPVTGSYRPRVAVLPHPGFTPGADLRLVASASDGFALRGWGVSPLEPPTSPVEVAAGAVTRLAWRAPSQAGPARVQALLHVNHHGNSNAWIECELPDTGSAEIPAPLIDALLAEGRSGFPTITLSRRTATSALIQLGCVQLLVRTSVSAGVSVSGLTSCNDSSMCPTGQSCRALERFCE